MSRYKSILVIASILVLVSLLPAYGQIETSFSFKHWQTEGYLNWTAAGYTQDPYTPGRLIPFRSELDWDLKADMLVCSVAVQPFSWSSIDITYGTGTIQSGTCTDTDWLLSYSSSIPWSKTENPFYGTSYLLNVNLNLYPLQEKSGSLALFMGYETNTLNLVNIDPLSYVYSEWIYYGGVDTSPGLNSTYNITWKEFRIGLKGMLQPLPQLSLNGKLSYSPVKVNGEGFWNLRADVDPDGWRFYQSGSGDSLEYSVGISIIPVEHSSLEFGYKAQLFKTTQSQSWESCELKQSGWFVSWILQV